MAPNEPDKAVSPGNVGAILWRQRAVFAVIALIVLVVGGAVVTTRPKVYQSTSSVALLPATKNQNILPSYPGLIINLIPTYIQLVSSPVLLDRVAANLPFHISEPQLASSVNAESLSNAAIINIVARSNNPVQAREIASAVTRSFVGQLHGNRVVVARVYGPPSAAQPTPPSRALLLGVVVILALILGAAGGLLWSRLPRAAIPSDTSEAVAERLPADPSPSARARGMASRATQPTEPLETVRLLPSGHGAVPGESGTHDNPGEAR